MSSPIQALIDPTYEGLRSSILHFLPRQEMGALRCTCRAFRNITLAGKHLKIPEYISPAKLNHLNNQLQPRSLSVTFYYPTDAELRCIGHLPITELDLSHSISTDMTLVHLTRLPLRKLAIGLALGTTTKGLCHLASLPVQELDLTTSVTWIGEGLEHFIGHRHLQSIKLGRVDPFLESFKRALQKLPVQELTLKHGSESIALSDKALECLTGLQQGSSLHLELSNPLLEEEYYPSPYTNSALLKLSYLGIRTLHLRVNKKITNEELAALGTLRALRSLTLEILPEHLVTAYGLAYLSKLALTELNFTYLKADLSDMDMFHIGQLTQLESLTLQLHPDARLTALGFVCLKPLMLHHLYLRNVKQFTDDALAHLKKVPLKSLDVRGCPITDKGLMSTSKMIFLKSLRLPSLSESPAITTKGLAHLHILPLGMGSITVKASSKVPVFLQMLNSSDPLIPLQRIDRRWKIFIDNIESERSFKLIRKKNMIVEESPILVIKTGEEVDLKNFPSSS